MHELRPPTPVLVRELFAPERSALLGVLNDLSKDDWERQTVCPDWSVKDITSHILGGDLGKLSRSRDDFHRGRFSGQNDLSEYLANINEDWVRATRRLSPRVLCDLLASTAGEAVAYYWSLDLFAPGEPVSWAGPRSAPVWLDLAREYTERWVHQQQIRDAVGRPGLDCPRFLAPVLATFARALPHTFRDVDAPLGTMVGLTITGDAGSEWTIVRQADGWVLFEGAGASPSGHVEIDEDTAWRIMSRGISADAAERKARLEGDRRLAFTILQTVSIIAARA